jgi:hypothetical protein
VKRSFFIDPAAVIVSVGSSAISELPASIERSRAITADQKQDLLEAVTTIFKDCNTPNWDEEGATAVSPKAWINAEKLISILPNTGLLASAFATRNGKIGVQWTKSPRAALSLLVDGSGQLTYAAIFPDGRKKHGYEHFDGTNAGDVREHLLQISSQPS